MRVSELVRREPSPDPGRRGGAVQLGSDASRPAGSAAGRATDHTEQCAGWQPGTELEPWVELLPGPTVHADLAALVTFAVLCRGGRNAELVLLVTVLSRLSCRLVS